MDAGLPPPLPRPIKPGSKKTRGGMVYSKWNHLFPNAQFSAQEYYQAVEDAAARHEIPEMKASRVAWKEGSLLSSKREYLRLERRRYIYDLCAAPFGKDYFFSSWLVIIPAALTIFHCLGMGTTALVLYLAFRYGGFGILWLVLILSIVLLVLIRKNLLENVIQDRIPVEEFLLGMSIWGAIYDVFFRPFTYFEADTAAMFESAVHGAMMEIIDGFSKAKGIRLLTEDERKPMIGILFKFYSK